MNDTGSILCLASIFWAVLSALTPHGIEHLWIDDDDKPLLLPWLDERLWKWLDPDPWVDERLRKWLDPD